MVDHEIKINKYIVKEIIGKGAFGKVLRGEHERTKELVAVKMENKDTPYPLLKREASILNHLYSLGSRNTPSVYWFGPWNDSLCMVLPLYDVSLYERRKQKEIAVDTVNQTMIKALELLEFIHTHFVLHRDIKPQNFMIKDGELFLIDFGFATFYMDENKKHIQPGSRQHIIGSPKYISIHVHSGVEPSLRDDLISLGYMYIYLLFGELEWDTIPSETNVELLDETDIHHYKNRYILGLKRLENLKNILFKSHPVIVHFFKYAYSLRFDEPPHYDGCKKLFLHYST